MNRLTPLSKVVLAVAIIGALNWGLVGFFNWNLINAIFGGSTRAIVSPFSRFIYALVGLCGVAAAFLTPWRQTVSRTHPIGSRLEVS